MPTYDYQCMSCGKRFEYFQSMSSPSLTYCPESICENAAAKGTGLVERKIGGGAGLIFSGSGFYLTDYVRSSSSEQSSPTSSTKSAGAAKAPATSESNAAASSSATAAASDSKSV